jgi:hypothetical protein
MMLQPAAECNHVSSVSHSVNHPTWDVDQILTDKGDTTQS